jgi:hypothetical protein
MNKNKTFGVLILVIGLIITLSSFLISKTLEDDLVSNLVSYYYNQESGVAKQTATILEGEIANVETKLYLIAQIPEVKNGNTDICNTKLQELFVINHGQIGNLGRVGQDGFFACSLNKKLIGIKASTLGSYITDIFNDPQHKPVMSRAIKPPGSTSYLVGIHVPVYQGKIFVGTIGGAIYFNDLQAKFLSQVTLSQNGNVVLIDDDGTILSHSNKNLIGQNISSNEVQKLDNHHKTFQGILDRVKNGETGKVRYTFDNVDKIATFAPIMILPGRTWTTIITTPITDINNQLADLGVGKI